MFIDYLTVMIINLVAGLFLLAVHLVFFVNNDEKKLAPGFLVTGLISTVTGFHLAFTWPLPGANNIPISEMSILFGVLFLVAGFALIFEWDLLGISIVAAFAGLASIVIGLRYFSLGMSQEPVLSGLGYIIAGVGAMLTVALGMVIARQHRERHRQPEGNSQCGISEIHRQLLLCSSRFKVLVRLRLRPTSRDRRFGKLGSDDRCRGRCRNRSRIVDYDHDNENHNDND